MGQKINPIGLRTGSFKPWKSRWFAQDREYKETLIEDIKIRKALEERLKLAGLDSVEIERLPNVIKISLFVARPGVVIGRGGSGIEDLKKFIVEKIAQSREVEPSKLKDLKIDIPVMEVSNPEISAALVASRIVNDLERRLPHRRVVARAMERVMASGAKGIKVVLSGRIGGADIGRKELFQSGSVPTQTMREEIDYAEVPALLKKGYVGVKVWIHKERE